MRTQSKELKLNGVDVAKLKATVGQVAREPGLGRFEFRATNRWHGGTHSRTRIKEFYALGREDTSRDKAFEVVCGEPDVLCGVEDGPNPVEHLLNALLGCMTAAVVLHASARGITIESIESRAVGDIDFGGVFGVNDEAPRGYRGIDVDFKIKSDATPEQLTELSAYSPVFNTLINPTPVRVKIEDA